jgi:hypothetical protein
VQIMQSHKNALNMMPATKIRSLIPFIYIRDHVRAFSLVVPSDSMLLMVIVAIIPQCFMLRVG